MSTSTPTNTVNRQPHALPSATDFAMHRHAEEAVLLRCQITLPVSAPDVGLLQLAQLNEHIEAQLDSLLVAGEVGHATARRGLDDDTTRAALALGLLGDVHPRPRLIEHQHDHAALLRDFRQPAQPLLMAVGPAWRQRRWLAA